MKDEDTEKVIKAEVPLSEMFGYISKLRSLTKGRGTFTMKLVGYRIVPKHIEKQIIKKFCGEE